MRDAPQDVPEKQDPTRSWELQVKDLIITPAAVLKEKPDPDTLEFRTVFMGHMLTVEWSSDMGESTHQAF